MHLNHVTLDTGHAISTPRDGVGPAITQLLAPWLDEITGAGSTHPLPILQLSHISASAFIQHDCLVFTLYAPVGPHAPGCVNSGEETMLVTMAVAKSAEGSSEMWMAMLDEFASAPDLEQPATPWCAVVIHPGLAALTGDIGWVGNIERSIAWTWLTRHPALRVA